MNQNQIKKRVGLALRRFLEVDGLSRKYWPYFGCDAYFLRDFIAYQFSSQMSWDNFGKVWKVGHVLPPREFDQSDEGDLKMCWNWINMRPVGEMAARSALSGAESLRLLEWRRGFFKDNPVIGKLVVRAKRISGKDGRSFLDWSVFSVEH